VLVIGDSEELGELRGRQAVPFSASEQDALAQLERRRDEGAQFVLAFGDGLGELSAHAVLGERLERGRRLVDDRECRVYTLDASKAGDPHSR